MASWPVRPETIAIRGGANTTDRATCRNSSSMPSMCAEWKAWLVRRRAVRLPCSRRDRAIASTARDSPEITVAAGPFTAAMATSPS